VSYDYLVPIVVKQTPRGERSFDIYSRLLEERIIFVGADIDDGLASSIIAQLLFLQGEDEMEPVNMYIMSRGGGVNAGLAVYDTMQYVRPPLHTWCVGQAASIAAVLLAGGAPEHRAALPSSKVVIHQPWVPSISGAATDLEIHARELTRTRGQINEILAEHTGQAVEKIEQDTDRDFFMTAAEAVEYGIVDFVAEATPTPAPSAEEK
jgi:ATP-dependent Clp protease protease subunit